MAHNLIFRILTCQFVQHWQVEQVCHGCQDVWSIFPCLVLNWTVGHRGGKEQKLALKSGIQKFFFHSLNRRPSDVLSFLWKNWKFNFFRQITVCSSKFSHLTFFCMYIEKIEWKLWLPSLMRSSVTMTYSTLRWFFQWSKMVLNWSSLFSTLVP